MGVRRFQNEDGSLTEYGKRRYYSDGGVLSKRGQKALSKELKRLNKIEKKLDVQTKQNKISSINKRANVARDVAYVATGATLLGDVGYIAGKAARVAATGFYAYSKIRVGALKKSISQAALSEATAKAKEQTQRIINSFGREVLKDKK